MIELSWSERSDVGRRRATNEDSVIASPPVFAVADGMGGHAAGDVASELAIERLVQLAGRDVTRREVLEAIRQADVDIACRAEVDDTPGMGTTVTGLVFIGSGKPESDDLADLPGPSTTGALVEQDRGGPNRAVVFNVGDSRSYLFRRGHLTQISHDHSVVQELIDDGVISPTQAETHPERNVITRALGSEIPLDIDWWVIEPATGDRYLLCSDGLFKEVGESEITRVLAGTGDPDEAADALLKTALDHGGSDNISLVIVDIIRIGSQVVPEPIDETTQPSDTAGGDDTNPHGRRRPPEERPVPVITGSSIPGPLPTFAADAGERPNGTLP